MSVLYLIASPLARGLFHRAIVQSGGASIAGGLTLNARTLAEAEADGLRFSKAKGAHSLAELPSLSWQRLKEAQPTVGSDQGNLLFRFAPIVDGYLLPAPYRQVVAWKRHNDVALITGINSGELDGLVAEPKPVALVSIYLWAKERAESSNTEAYFYLWDHAIPGPDAALYGAFHSSELPFLKGF